MGGLLTLMALGLLVFYVWGTAAFWQVASRERLQLLYILVAWNLVAALGSLFLLLNLLQSSVTLLGLIGAGLAVATPVLWELGRVGRRLRQYGLSRSRIYSFSR